MTKRELQDLSNNWRHSLLATLSIRVRSTDAQLAEDLTENAIEQRYIEPRPPVKGAMLAGWRKKGNKPPPAWVCQSACDLLLLHQWVPLKETDWALVAYFHLRGKTGLSVDEALSTFPNYLDRGRLRPYVDTLVRDDSPSDPPPSI